SEVYWLFAVQLVAEEARLYQEANVDPTQPTRPYRWCVASKKPPTSSPLSSNPPTVTHCRRSLPASTCRCSSTCPAEIANPASTRCPPPRYERGCRSPYDVSA